MRMKVVAAVAKKKKMFETVKIFFKYINNYLTITDTTDSFHCIVTMRILQCLLYCCDEIKFSFITYVIEFIKTYIL